MRVPAPSERVRRSDVVTVSPSLSLRSSASKCPSELSPDSRRGTSETVDARRGPRVGSDYLP
jgi:hypothetical protein